MKFRVIVRRIGEVRKRWSLIDPGSVLGLNQLVDSACQVTSCKRRLHVLRRTMLSSTT